MIKSLSLRAMFSVDDPMDASKFIEGVERVPVRTICTQLHNDIGLFLAFNLQSKLRRVQVEGGSMIEPPATFPALCSRNFQSQGLTKPSCLQL